MFVRCELEAMPTDRDFMDREPRYATLALQTSDLEEDIKRRAAQTRLSISISISRDPSMPVQWAKRSLREKSHRRRVSSSREQRRRLTRVP